MPITSAKNKSKKIALEDEKSVLAIKLLSLKDEAVIHAFHVLFDDLTSNPQRTSKAQYNKEIDAAVKRVRNGKFVSNDEVMNEMDAW
ncbi:MAG: hypothetical protein ACRCYO_00605 [Bacteroidia bacterium]